MQGFGNGYQGPGSKTIVQGAAMAKIDFFRLVPDQDPEDIFLKLRSHLDAEGFSAVEVERLGWMRPARTNPDDPFVQFTARAAKDVYGGESAIVPMNGGLQPRKCVQGTPRGDPGRHGGRRVPGQQDAPAGRADPS